MEFPKNFKWGVATAAFQIEGHPEEYSKKFSDWAIFLDEKKPDGSYRVMRPSNDGKAVDHWSHMEEDIKLLYELGVNSYRFSFNWAAIHRAPGEFDSETLDFYKRLFAELKKYNIEPYPTLVHFTLPAWLYEKGGWESPETAYAFEEYTQKILEEFAGEKNASEPVIVNWTTHNEPNIYLFFGYEVGIWPPAYENDWNRYFQAYQGMLLAHGLAYEAIKEHNPKHQIGFAQNLYDFQTLGEGSDIVPTTIRAHLHNYAFVQDAFDIGALDFLGVNYYTRVVYEFNSKPFNLINPSVKSDLWGEMKNPRDVSPEAEITDLNWEVYPEGLYKALSDPKLKRIIGDMPIYISENGYCHIEGASAGESYSSFETNFGEDGTEQLNPNLDLDDQYRIDFIKSHLKQASRAIADGVNLQGYFYWSFLDNFEWALGMSPRFGLVHVDHKSFKRTKKASFKYYSSLASGSAVAL